MHVVETWEDIRFLLDNSEVARPKAVCGWCDDGKHIRNELEARRWWTGHDCLAERLEDVA